MSLPRSINVGDAEWQLAIFAQVTDGQPVNFEQGGVKIGRDEVLQRLITRQESDGRPGRGSPGSGALLLARRLGDDARNAVARVGVEITTGGTQSVRENFYALAAALRPHVDAHTSTIQGVDLFALVWADAIQAAHHDRQRRPPNIDEYLPPYLIEPCIEVLTRCIPPAVQEDLKRLGADSRDGHPTSESYEIVHEAVMELEKMSMSRGARNALQRLDNSARTAQHADGSALRLVYRSGGEANPLTPIVDVVAHFSDAVDRAVARVPARYARLAARCGGMPGAAG